jgi:CoA:oxalate CoA-transferase
MGSITRLGELLACPELLNYTRPEQLFEERDEIKSILVEHLQLHSTAYWLSLLEPADVWCSDVLTWDKLFAHEGFQALDMMQTVVRPPSEKKPGITMRTTRCPIRIDGELLTNAKPAPRIGEHNHTLTAEFHLDSTSGEK